MTQIVKFNKEKNRLARRRLLQPIKKYGVLTILLAVIGASLLFYEDHGVAPRLDAQIPEISIDASGKELTVLENDEDNHFVFIGEINGVKVKFLYDTGATDIAIPLPVANYLNLSKGRERKYFTANGTTTGFDTTLRDVTIGHIKLENIQASIASNMPGDKILLGMSFLSKIDISQTNGKLYLSTKNN